MARCVFVGNIPYDATEEQLIQICEEVGPVVSFRLVTDRETGKPKGYGFCEYKDEETALSARRNLLGYEINGRQLRIDFAENDKGLDKNREQGRGGPGMTATADTQKQVGGPASLGDFGHQQPIGLTAATTAASIMTGALGGAQVANKANPNGLYNQAGMGSDPITLHLAKLSRNQLNAILTDLKVMATDDKEVAQQLLLANPQLSKALFQAQIMLGMVTPDMLQMPNIRQGALLQPSSQDAQHGRLSTFQADPGLPPFTQSNGKFGMMPIVHDGQGSRVQMPHAPPTQFQQQPSFPAQSGISKPPSMNQKMQAPPPLSQPSGPNEIANSGHNRQPVNPNVVGPPLNRPPISDPSYQSQSSMISNILVSTRKDSDSSGQATNMISGPMKSNIVYNNLEPMGRPSKLIKLDDGQSIPSSIYGLNGPTTSGSRPFQAIGMGSSSYVKQIPNTPNPQSEQEVAQMQFAPEAESALLQQVMKLTPEQLRSLTPDQQQQVIQLQKMFR